MTEFMGNYFMLNGQGVTAPDDVDWPHINIGEALDGLQRRSPYRVCTWDKNVDPGCAMDWFDFDNTELTEFICPPPDNSRTSMRYTEAFCQSVKGTFHHGVLQNIRAVFLVRVN